MKKVILKNKVYFLLLMLAALMQTLPLWLVYCFMIVSFTLWYRTSIPCLIAVKKIFFIQLGITWLLDIAICALNMTCEQPFLVNGKNVPYSLVRLIEVLTLAPIAEEVFFRGLIWDLIQEKLKLNNLRNQVYTTIVVSALFGIYHLGFWDWKLSSGSMFQVGFTAICGLFLAYGRIVTGKLNLSILLHGFGNWVILVLQSLFTSK